ncbi:MAG: hypothetical protein Q8P18_34820 [Pseudomonadota bacterium]|nr:hypothetical protein [Pseudomonadota bacterium]
MNARLFPLLLLLSGCAWLTEAELLALADTDADSVPAWEDCDDGDPTVGAPAARFEDLDGDRIGGAAVVACPDASVATDGDCDDADPAVGLPGAWYADGDGDGFVGTAGSPVSCAPPDDAATTAPGLDCDDAAATVHPDAVEDCNNGIDDDCDADTDDCDLRDAGLVLTYGEEAGGLGGFPSLFVPTPKGYDDLVIGRPWGHVVESYSGARLPASGVFLLGDPDWELRDGPLSVGNALAGGDLDGDGVGDLVAGAVSSTDPEAPYGREPKVVFLHGTVYAGNSAVDLTIVAETDTSQFGHEVAIGDLDYDGIGDLAMAAPGGEDGCGAVYVAYGSASFPEWEQVNAYYNDPDTRGVKLYGSCEFEDRVPEGGFGSAVLTVPGELNEVRPALLAIGDPNAERGRGALYVWRPGTLPTEPARTLDLSSSADVAVWTGADEGGLAGISIASGDLDGDGRADLVTGALYANVDGAVYVIHDVANQAGGSLFDADVEVAGEPSEDGATAPAFGYAVAVVPDVNGDGYDELAVGAPHWSSSRRGVETGAVYLFHGPLAGASIDAANADRRLYGTYAEEDVGWALDAGGDLDGDGKGDLLVGAQGWSPDGVVHAGAIVVLWGAEW